MLRAYKYRIYPTDEQKVLFAKTFGCCRFVYNWALNLKIEAYKQDKKYATYKEVQDRMVNELKKGESMADRGKFTSPPELHPQP